MMTNGSTQIMSTPKSCKTFGPKEVQQIPSSNDARDTKDSRLDTKPELLCKMSKRESLTYQSLQPPSTSNPHLLPNRYSIFFLSRKDTQLTNIGKLASLITVFIVPLNSPYKSYIGIEFLLVLFICLYVMNVSIGLHRSWIGHTLHHTKIVLVVTFKHVLVILEFHHLAQGIQGISRKAF